MARYNTLYLELKDTQTSNKNIEIIVSGNSEPSLRSDEPRLRRAAEVKAYTLLHANCNADIHVNMVSIVCVFVFR